jgi:phosphate transport system permease protein
LQPSTPFTGRTRRRTTHPWARAADAVARFVITAGGIGAIVAVLGVLVFLVAVTAPLFRSATLSATRQAPLAAESDASVVAVGCDESGLVAWTLFRDGRFDVFSTASGSLLTSRSAAETGLADIQLARPFAADLSTVLAFENGFALGRLGLESSFVALDELPEEFQQLGDDQAAWDGESIILHHADGHFGRLRPVTEMGELQAVGDARLIDVDATQLASGPLVAALTADGSVRIETISQRRNLLTDELITEATGTTLETSDSDDPAEALRFVRVSELGDQVFLIRADGRGTRYEIRTIEMPQEMEQFALVSDGAELTAITRLFGGNTLVVGESSGAISTWFLSREQGTAEDDQLPADGLQLAKAASFSAVPSEGAPAAITSLAGSPRSRLFAAADTSGRVRLLHSTTSRELGRTTADDEPLQLVIAPREDALLASSQRTLQTWSLAPGYPAVSFASLFGKVWYENYPAASHVWETTGHESFEPKFGLVPLIFGTIKATLYSMLFAVPIAILAAIYSSQFMRPELKATVKPTIEMMASLPSVVLGFIAGLVFAPVLEQHLSVFLTSCFTVPLALLTGAHLWQLMPSSARTVYQRLRFPVVLLVTIPGGILAGVLLGPQAEGFLFDGDLLAWLDGQGGNSRAGWTIATLPLSGLVAAYASQRFVSPVLRERSAGWSGFQAGLVSLVTFIAAVAVALSLAGALGGVLDSLRIDTRGGIFGTYVQRNAMVVGIGMSFAIIPLIFTIADDALSSVPEHLRSASLGAGATPWQTVMRVIVPAASGGIFSAVMIGLGRAVGETMIVLMAAGNTPLLKWNIFNGFQTLSAALATELPEAARGTAHYRVLFLAAFTLFAMTFVVNTAAEVVRQRVRRRSHEL